MIIIMVPIIGGEPYIFDHRKGVPGNKTAPHIQILSIINQGLNSSSKNIKRKQNIFLLKKTNEIERSIFGRLD